MITHRAWGMDSERGAGWWERAACKGENPDWWVLAAKSDRKQMALNGLARTICERCPVAAQCLAENERMGSTGVIAAGHNLGTAGRPAVAKARICRRAGCGTTFTTRVPNALYCGDACRKKVRHAQEMARIRAYKARQRAAVGV